MNLTRRQALALSAGAVAFAASGLTTTVATADTAATAKAIAAFAGGKTPQSGKVKLTAPEIAENGNVVPVAITVDSEMSEKSYVQAVMLVAEDNPNPDVITFNFTPLSGEASAKTRMRLAKTQNVIAVARMNDGSVYMDKKQVKVTIGGCGG